MKIYKNKICNNLKIKVYSIKKNVVYYEYIFSQTVCDFVPMWEMSLKKLNERYEVSQ